MPLAARQLLAVHSSALSKYTRESGRTSLQPAEVRKAPETFCLTLRQAQGRLFTMRISRSAWLLSNNALKYSEKKTKVKDFLSECRNSSTLNLFQGKYINSPAVNIFPVIRKGTILPGSVSQIDHKPSERTNFY